MECGGYIVFTACDEDSICMYTIPTPPTECIVKHYIRILGIECTAPSKINRQRGA